VRPPSSSTVYFGSGSNGNSAAQRVYDRKVELLSAGLYPLVSDQAPADMNVIVLAWGPSAPNNFVVEGHSTSTEELNLWADLVPVSLPAGNEQPALSAGSVPYTVYAPGNNPSLLVWTGSGPIASSSNPGPPPTVVPAVIPTTAPSLPGRPAPTPFVPGGPAAQAQSIHVSPYADVHYRLPAGVKPLKLSLVFSIGQSSPAGDFDLMAYNVTSGSWDNVGTIQTSSATQSSTVTGTLTIPNPADYTGTAGDVIIRLRPKGGDTTLTNVTLNLELNGK